MAKRTNYKPLDERLWKFLRQGLAYLETSGKPVPTTYVHPGGYAYGPLGLTNIAIQDVQRFFAEPERLTLKDIIKQPAIYEDYARKYADILLNRYLGKAGIDYTQLTPAQIFDILQRMWFYGPSGYKKQAPKTRAQRAKEFLATFLR